jgi:hypothetical protein
MCAQPKVVVKIESEEDMLVLQVSMSNFFVSPQLISSNRYYGIIYFLLFQGKIVDSII